MEDWMVRKPPHGTVPSHDLHNILRCLVTVLSPCALCLATADCNYQQRSENPTWYRLKPFASLLSSFSSLHRVFLQAPSSIAFYLGRHYRYLVSCLTAGAKRCVGLVPLEFALLYLLIFLGTLHLQYSPSIDVSPPVSPFPPPPQRPVRISPQNTLGRTQYQNTILASCILERRSVNFRALGYPFAQRYPFVHSCSIRPS